MKKARVLLLNPPTAAESGEVILSLAYLAASLRKHGHQVKVIDATAPYKPLNAGEVKREILDFQPHFIGVTLTITFIAQTYVFLEELAKMGLPIVAGGPHVNPLPEETLAHGVDIAVLGEGENTIVELADYFAGNRSDLKSIPGLCIGDDKSRTLKTAPRLLIENLDEIPFPAFEDFPIRNYTGSDDVNSNPIFWSIFSSRGCPFNCTFCCGHNVFGRTYRLRSAENVFDEIKSLADKFGVEKVAFQDDEILLSKERLFELCRMLSKSKLKVQMSLRGRIDSIENRLLKEMQNAGLRRISFGIESWNEETLAKIKKRYDTGKIRRGLEIIKQTNFPHINLNTIAGFPWETKAHLQKNIAAMSQIPSSLRYFAVINTPIPYPNTELYDKYHDKYGFTNWWLDPAKHANGFAAGQPRPLFYYFAKTITPLYAPNCFWNYSAEQKRELEKFSWQVFAMYVKRHLAFGTYVLVYMLSRISHAVWKMSPRLEHYIFKRVPKGFIHKIENLLSFVKMK